jgi:hypothetical protein
MFSKIAVILLLYFQRGNVIHLGRDKITYLLLQLIFKFYLYLALYTSKGLPHIQAVNALQIRYVYKPKLLQPKHVAGIHIILFHFILTGCV